MCEHASVSTDMELDMNFQQYPMLRRIMPESYDFIREADYCDKKGLCNFNLLENE